MRRHYDIAVVGAGPAGTLAARQLALRGARVVLLEKHPFPREKVCGCCINGQAMAVLQRVGLGDLLSAHDAVPLDRLRLLREGRQATVPLPGGVALSRGRLDFALASAAVRAGVDFVDRATARLIALGEAHESTPHRLEVGRGEERAELRATVLVVADGLQGRLLEDVEGFEVMVRRRSRLGAGVRLAGGDADIDGGEVVMACGNRGYVGLVRLEDGSVDVAAALDLDYVQRMGGPAPAAAAIARRTGLDVGRAWWDARWQGTPTLTRQRRCVAAERLFVIGDAAGYVEPFTGEGIAWALMSGEAVTDLALAAVVSPDPELAEHWAQRHRRLVGARMTFCRGVAAVLRRPALTAAAVRLLAWQPAMAAPIVWGLNGGRGVSALTSPRTPQPGADVTEGGAQASKNPPRPAVSIQR